MRKRYIRKVVLAGMTIVLACATFSGCDIKSDTPIVGSIVGLKSNEMFKIEELVCSKAEYMLVMMNTANQYKKDFGGTVDWDAKVDDKMTIREFVKNKVKEEITVKYALASMAEKSGVSLTEEEKKAIEENASLYYSSLTDAEKKYTDAEQKDVSQLYTNYMLADKVYSKITEKAGEDISEEEARVIKIQYIRMDTDSQKDATIIKTLKKAKEIVEAGYQAFSREAKQYSLDDTIERVVKKNEASEKYELEAFNLSKGKISDVITDGNNYYLIYCIDNYMKDETTKNKEELQKQAKDEYMKEEYRSFIDNSENDFNSKQWKKIDIEDNENISNTSLFTAK